ncbi:hypothetical protein KC343_g1260 [Hortaea werneckii]|nr:hypothetical protein KC338_g6374 [Hortaea werneckii]KAI6865523.1 hypothetical protein KC323_g4295 [Hortaea werneckii]KAI7283293.1 hypothetical protein KC352_g5867 [Hortaea werneckii]KAI7567418.1 hypothetical protein KC317_g4994 [Hortaea werneckii]KAI7623426.1 hypothetical protein KC346_g2747 [Hortaea werneckii]
MAATTSLVPTCASCVFGAVSTSVLSYTAHVIKTIEVDVTPHVFIYLNGTRETTSLESNTHTEAIAIPTGNTAESVDSSQTFSDIRDVTWTVGDATLTYPTSYIQYLAFAGAPAINTDEPACAEQTDATNVQLPTTTDAAEFIFPLGNASSGIGLPGELLDYLDSLPTVSDQFNGAPVTACAPLLHSTYTPSPVYSTIQAKPTARTKIDASSASSETLLPKRYEGPRGNQHQGPIVTLSPDAKNNTQGIGRRQDLSGSGFATGTGTEGFAFPSAPEETASTGSRTSLAYSSIEATNVHTTAFVIAPITGRDIVTSESPSHGPTTHGGNTDTATALPANSGGDDSKPNENGEQGSSSGNGDSSTDGEANSGASGGNDGSSSSGQTGGSENDGDGHNSGHSDNGSQDGSSDEESGGDSTGHSASDGSGSSEHSDNDAGSHSGGQSATTGSESGDGAGEQSGSSDTSSHSTGYDDAQGQSGGESSSHNNSGDGASEGSQEGGEGSQDQSGSAAGSSAGNGDASQTSGSNGDDNAEDGQDISNLLGGIASAASNIDQAGGDANTAHVQAAQATFTADGNSYTAVKQGDAVVAVGASATFTVPGGSGTVFEGQTISAASDGKGMAVNGQQQTLTAPEASPSYDQTTLTEAGRTFTASQAEGTAIVFNEGGSSMMVQGAEQTGFAGETVSVQPNGDAFVLGGQTISFNAAAPTSSSAVFTAGTHTITAVQADDALILKDSTSTITVSDGAETTFEGQAVSVASNGQSVIFGSQTITFDSVVTPGPSRQAVFTVDDHTITAKQTTNSMIIQEGSSNITVQDGATTRFEGEDLSIASDGSSIVVDGTSTVVLTQTTSASSTGMGGYINSGLSPGASATDGTQSFPSSTSTITSGSGGLRAESSFVIAAIGLCGIALM